MVLSRTLAVTLALAVSAPFAAAEEAQLAVAANFAAPAKQLAEQFAQRSGHKLAISAGSTGKFYAQIANGAPFDVFLSADEETPRRLEREKLAVPGSALHLCDRQAGAVERARGPGRRQGRDPAAGCLQAPRNC